MCTDTANANEGNFPLVFGQGPHPTIPIPFPSRDKQGTPLVGGNNFERKGRAQSKLIKKNKTLTPPAEAFEPKGTQTFQRRIEIVLSQKIKKSLDLDIKRKIIKQPHAQLHCSW